MKWSKKTAQGFSPGKVFQVIALLGRPIGVRCLYQHVVIELQSELILYEQRSQRVIHLAALSGRVLNPGFPRAKALGCSLKPFHGLHAIRNAQRRARAARFFLQLVAGGLVEAKR